MSLRGLHKFTFIQTLPPLTTKRSLHLECLNNTEAPCSTRVQNLNAILALQTPARGTQAFLFRYSIKVDLCKGPVIKYGEFARVCVFGRGGGGLQNGKIAGLKLFAPPPHLKLVIAPTLFKRWKLCAPPFSTGMVITSSFCVKVTSYTFVPRLQHAWLKLVPPPFFFVGVNFNCPPPPPRH